MAVDAEANCYIWQLELLKKRTILRYGYSFYYDNALADYPDRTIATEGFSDETRLFLKQSIVAWS